MMKKQTTGFTKPSHGRVKRKDWLIAGALMLGTTAAMAALPTVTPPTSGAGTGFLGQLQGYAQDGVLVVGLIIAAIAFLMVASSTMGAYAELGAGRGSIGGVAMRAGLGVLILILVVWMVTESSTVLT